MLYTKSDIAKFRRTVWKYFKEHRRDLPWRRTTNPYRIMVSEVMLQQTQVPRVIEKYKEFLKEFPTVRSLADATLSDVLRVWSGLGYNRRAKFLHEAAKQIVKEHKGRVPKVAEELEALPGIGHYTARAICAFAYNTPSVFIETNIRSVFIHHFFPEKEKVSDTELLPLIAVAAEGQNPRDWYAALMDYGAYLKQKEGNASRKSAHHTVQKKFKGSLREARGLVLKNLAQGAASLPQLQKSTGFAKERIENALTSLAKDGLIKKSRTRWLLA